VRQMQRGAERGGEGRSPHLPTKTLATPLPAAILMMICKQEGPGTRVKDRKQGQGGGQSDIIVCIN
jgi:hypothetical protein